MASLNLDPYGVSNSQTCPHGAPSRSSTSVQVLLSWRWFLLPSVHPGRLGLFVHLSVQLQGWCMVCPVTSSLLGIQEGLLVFQFVQFLVVGCSGDSRLLRREPETRGGLFFGVLMAVAYWCVLGFSAYSYGSFGSVMFVPVLWISTISATLASSF